MMLEYELHAYQIMYGNCNKKCIFSLNACFNWEKLETGGTQTHISHMPGEHLTTRPLGVCNVNFRDVAGTIYNSDIITE